MANPTVIKLQDGNVMPQLGLGVWQASNEEVITAIQKALEVGYRSAGAHVPPGIHAPVSLWRCLHPERLCSRQAKP